MRASTRSLEIALPAEAGDIGTVAAKTTSAAEKSDMRRFA
jgi:hypothetical protein